MSSGDVNLCKSDVGIYDGPTTTDIGSECYNPYKGKIHNGIAWVVLHEASSQKCHKVPRVTIFR